MRSMLAIWMIALLTVAAAAQDTAWRDSVVRLHVTGNTLNLRDPWTSGSQAERKGTGFVIDGERIITNAHVVILAQEILVESDLLPRKVVATVEHIAEGMDLAVLRVEEPGFFELIPPVRFIEDLPNDQDEVTVLGYPIGGEVMSATSGVVSRVEYARYSRRDAGLRVQIDAAVNPGNSGGPAFADGGCIGVVFSRGSTGENIGYVIPSLEVARFLDDIADGTYDGKPALRGEFVTTDNPGRRRKLALSLTDTGLTVIEPVEGTGLRRWDVIAEVGGRPIDDLGNGELFGRKLRMAALIDDAIDEEGRVELTIIRDGERMRVMADCVEPPEPLFGEEGDAIPYFVHGPFVFVTASEGYANIVLREQYAPALLARQNPLATRRYELRAFPDEEIVILSRGPFSHPLLRGHDDLGALMVLDSVNGVTVRNLAHAYSLIRDCRSEMIELEFMDRGYDRIVTLDRADLAESTATILDQNSIRKPVSDLLLEQVEGMQTSSD
jgi:S1-C subfamily serine protease